MTGGRVFVCSILALVWGLTADWQALTLIAICGVITTGIAFIWTRYSLAGIAFSRRVESDKLQVGDEIRELIRLENRSALPKLYIEIEDRSSIATHISNRVAGMGSHSAREWSTTSLARVRGHHQLGPVVIRSGDPLGLFRKERRLAGAIDLTIYPLIVNLNTYTPVSMLQSGGGVVQRRSTVPTAAVGGIRDYTIGDSINRISWTATARTGKLMVKEFEIDPTADLWIVLDLLATQTELVTATDWDLQSDDKLQWLGNSFEYRLMLTGSLVRRTLELGRSVGMMINSPQPVILPPERSDRQYVRILEHLASLDPVDHASLEELLIQVHHRFNRDSAVIVVTSHPTPKTIDLLGELRRRTISPEIVVVEPTDSGEIAHDEYDSTYRVPIYRMSRHDNPAASMNSALRFSLQGA